MRIISGNFKGRKLIEPIDKKTRPLKDLTKESMYETLLKTNSFNAPNSTIKEQADLMRKDALMRIGQSVENAEADLFPIDSFAEDASKRVRLDLLFAQLIDHFEIKIEKANIDAFIDEEAQRYKDPEQYKNWISVSVI